jgi:glyoxylase-like metal-dependent hydrolase (beta-lactamase superfamily II)
MKKKALSIAYTSVLLLLHACSQQGGMQPLAEPDTTAQQNQTEAAARGITHIAGDLYRVQNGAHFTVFMVTSAGIILADPINTEAATWLKSELEGRFDVPVRYVLYSHHHWDHASGAKVFEDTATLVGHANMASELEFGQSNFPVQVNIIDADGDQLLSRDEATDELATEFDQLDTDTDGYLSGTEILANVLPPQIVYSERMTITLGGKTVELIHPGSNHSVDATVLLFPEERAIYGVDFVNVKRLAFGFPGTGTLPEWIDSLKAVEALDFDIVSPGHSSVGTKGDFTAYREFFEDLHVAVTEAVNSGTTLEDLLASDALTKYDHLPNYDPQRNRNIQGAYNLLVSGND